MKFTIDTDIKTITIEEAASLQEVYTYFRDKLTFVDLEKYQIISKEKESFISYYPSYPIYVYPPHYYEGEVFPPPFYITTGTYTLNAKPE